MNTTQKTTRINFGKINYTGTGKFYPVIIDIELRRCGCNETFRIENGKKVPTGEKTPEYIEFSACGSIGKRCGGQCLDEIYPFLKNNADFLKVYTWWKKYHLNGMNAGTPEQTAAIEAWKHCGNKYDYDAVCNMLKDIGLYEIPFYGKSTGRVWNGENYRYGSACIIDEIPQNVIDEMERFIDAHNNV